MGLFGLVTKKPYFMQQKAAKMAQGRQNFRFTCLSSVLKTVLNI